MGEVGSGSAVAGRVQTHDPMNPTHTLLSGAVLLCAMSVMSTSLRAQGLAQVVPVASGAMGHAPSKPDLVGPDMQTVALRKAKDPMVRTTVRGADGSYGVRVNDANGQLRMEGSYSDVALNDRHGAFSFYHANGRLESAGMFAHGLKSGLWHCATVSGHARVDRWYEGLPWDDLQVLLGLATRAK